MPRGSCSTTRGSGRESNQGCELGQRLAPTQVIVGGRYAGGETTWAPTTILGGGASPVRELKSRGEGRLLVWGSRQLVQTIAAAGLVDEYVLYVHPLVLGRGARLFPDGRREKLELVDTKTYARGVVALRYRPGAT